jgi:tetratricopeptide (TPR) repeat protein
MESISPMVGRESELELLMSHMGKAMAGEGELVLISGEAGSGKTTLCEEFEKLAVKSGCTVLVGRCVPGALSPFLPFMEAFYTQVSNPFSDSNESVIVNRGRLLLSVLEALEHISKHRVTILWLEDLHWADSASIALLHFLARNVRTLNVLVIGTYRPEEIHANSSGESHPLQDSLRIMRREGICLELELNPLNPSDTKKIVPLRLGGIADERLLDVVAEESRGNPLFAVEMIRFLSTSRQIALQGGIWKLREDRKIQIPSTVREVIMARIEHVPKEAKKILECASIIGEWFDPDLIAESLDVKKVSLFEIVESLEKEHRLIMEAEGQYKFSHEKIRQVIHEQVSSHRRKELHKSIGLILEKGLPNNELLGQLSWHFDEANENQKCIKYSLLAGNYCLRRKAIREAKSYFQLVLARTDGNPILVAERLEALEGLGDLGAYQSSPREWYSYYEQFLELNQDRKARARILAKAAECWDQGGLEDTKKADELLDEAESLSEGDPRNLAVIELRRADLNGNSGKQSEALAHASKARRYFEEVGDSVGALRCRVIEGIVFRQVYRFAEAKALAEEVLSLARKSEDPELISQVGMSNAGTRARVGETELAKMCASEAIQQSDKLGLTWMWRYALRYRAWALELEGDLKSARIDLSKALESAKKYEAHYHIAFCEIDLGLCELELGLADSAERHYEEGLKILSTLSTWLRSLLSTDLSILRAEILAAKGDVHQSDEVYDETIRFCGDKGMLYELVNCRARYGMSLIRRGMQEKARPQFDEAMEVAKKIGCEKRVQALAKRVGIAFGLDE